MVRKLVYKTLSALGSFEASALERASYQPLAAQAERLAEILKANKETDFGGRHGFASIKSIADYQASVPISTYDDLSSAVERMCAGEKRVLTREDPFMFATTSGTTGKPKFIPVTKSFIREYRRASIASGYNMLKTFPALSRGVTLPFMSPAEEGRTAAGIPYGAISGQLYLREPALIKSFVAPVPYALFLIRDYEMRYYAVLRAALTLPVSIIYTLNPSTILLIVKKLGQFAPGIVKDIFDGTVPDSMPPEAKRALGKYLRPDKIRARALSALLEQGRFLPPDIWPELQAVTCWTKAAAAFYLKAFPDIFGDTPVCDITYGASEGRGTVALDARSQMLAVRSHFYEFVPEAEMANPKARVLTCDQLEVGQNYFILFTTSGGLYRYNINDVVKVVGFHNGTPLLEFQYKGGNVSSFTGEKLTELQATEAMSLALKDLRADVNFFTLVPCFADSPFYELWMEPPGTACDAPGAWPANMPELIALAFEEKLSCLNIEYKAKRHSQRLDPVRHVLLGKGAYESLRRKLIRDGVAEAQIKVSHLNPKPEIKEYLKGFLLP